MAYIVTAYVVMAYIVMAYIGMAYIAMAYLVMGATQHETWLGIYAHAYRHAFQQSVAHMPTL